MSNWLDESIYNNNKNAISDDSRTVTYQNLWQEVISCKEKLSNLSVNRIGLLMGNTIEWIVIDLACSLAKITLVPLPDFFSNAQLKNIIITADVDLIISDNCERIKELGLATQILDPNDKLGSIFRRTPTNRTALDGVAKVTFTSGSTSHPKGVLLSQASIESVVESMCSALSSLVNKHFCLLPLSTLLENIAGVYSSLQHGGEIYLTEQISIYSLNTGNTHLLFKFIADKKINTIILVPQILKLFVLWLSHKKQTHHLSFIAVGGAKSSISLLKAAQKLGLPVFEGYGLSEASSVVSLNTPLASKIGSVGRPLPHIKIKFEVDNEILIKTPVFEGYLGDPHPQSINEDGFWKTGDLGYLDEHGYLYLSGRKKNIIITSLGRNISPEWIEAELATFPNIAQAAVVYNNDSLVAIIFTNDANISTQRILRETNEKLPNFAHLDRIIVASSPFTISNSQLSQGGEPIREQILRDYTKTGKNDAII